MLDFSPVVTSEVVDAECIRRWLFTPSGVPRMAGAAATLRSFREAPQPDAYMAGVISNLAAEALDDEMRAAAELAGHLRDIANGGR